MWKNRKKIFETTEPETVPTNKNKCKVILNNRVESPRIALPYPGNINAIYSSDMTKHFSASHTSRQCRTILKNCTSTPPYFHKIPPTPLPHSSSSDALHDLQTLTSFKRLQTSSANESDPSMVSKKKCPASLEKIPLDSKEYLSIRDDSHITGESG